ncbi:MAG: carboxypeptidase regulatory-like domain-containing protein [Pyrinomonadaceae bacterium]
MRKFTKFLIVGLALLLTQLAIHAQSTGSIGGSVTDPNGAVVPGATVKVKGAAGQEFSAVTNDGGSYRIPSVANGVYSVTITATGFKTLTFAAVKVDVGTPVTVDGKLEIGNVGEVVEISSGGEVLQTQTAAVGTTIQGRQITGTPIASRDALDLVGLLPGTATVGRPRQASINGLPKGALTITIDGVDVQDNLLRSSDGYFTYVRPRVDAIEEVSVSTANPGAESGGDGAVQVKFVTKRGTNDYTGGMFYQHRNEYLNANYWFLNRNPVSLDSDNKSLRQKIRLHQYGAHVGGPIPFLGFGEGVGPFDSGKNKRFFFVNYEEFRQPESQSRTRVVLTPAAQSGIYSYVTGTTTNTVNVLNVAAANNQLATPDPTVAAVYNRIRSSLSGGALSPVVANLPNVQNFLFTPTSNTLRKFLALRLDFNITKNHSFEATFNRQKFDGTKDFLNSVEERFPGFPFYTQRSDRNSNSFAVRSTLSKSIVNEARYAVAYGLSNFFPGSSVSDFDYMGGRSLGVSVLGATSPVNLNSNSERTTPTYDLTDSVTWVKGSHSINFGGQYKRIKSEGSANNLLAPTVTFGLDSTAGSPDSVAFNMFNATTMPGATAAQITDARNLYAVLVGRVLGYGTTAYLGPDGKFAERGVSVREAEQKSYGLFIQDSWRAKSNFTINYGVRWQPQTAFVALSKGNYTALENFGQIYGLSGTGNIFKPGATGGQAPRVIEVPVGEKVYPDDLNNLAPTVGVVWSPNFGEKGLMHAIFGGQGQSVFRGGYSISYVREGTNLLESINGANPGGSLPLSRNLSTVIPGTTTVSFTAGTNLRDLNNPNLTPLPGIIGTAPAFPISLGTSNSANAFDPNIKTGAVHSFSFGYQREIDRNTVVEVRYVGNRGKDLQRQYNINEFNTIENGFADEFLLAQANLYANIAAGRGNSFAYFGAGTGTSPLPIMVSYFNPTATNNPNIAQGLAGSGYTAANFANTTLVAALSRLNPSINTFSGTSFENSASRRANAVANGRPANFFYVNSSVMTGGAFIVGNNSNTWYDSAVVEVRRRLSAGLRLSANYVFSKAQADSYASSSVAFAGYSLRPDGLDLAKGVQAFDLRHQFKLDATYDLPFGKGRKFMSGGNWAVDALFGGWSITPTLRWQSGSPFSFGNVSLVGMTVKELQKMIKVRKEADLVYYLPADIILNTQKAFDISVANTTTNNGYGTTFGTGGPTGKYIAPAGTGNCLQRYAGTCGFNNLVVYGPGFFKLDASIMKKINFGERRSLSLSATFLDALNHPNFRVGGWGADTVAVGVGGSTFGQLGNGTAWQDTSTTNDPGGRLIDLILRFNW